MDVVFAQELGSPYLAKAFAGRLIPGGYEPGAPRYLVYVADCGPSTVTLVKGYRLTGRFTAILRWVAR